MSDEALCGVLCTACGHTLGEMRLRNGRVVLATRRRSRSWTLESDEFAAMLPWTAGQDPPTAPARQHDQRPIRRDRMVLGLIDSLAAGASFPDGATTRLLRCPCQSLGRCPCSTEGELRTVHLQKALARHNGGRPARPIRITVTSTN